MFVANKGRVFWVATKSALSFVRSKWTPWCRCSKIEPSEKGCCRNSTEKVPVIYFVSGQGRGGQHIYILIVECVRKDWTVGCKLKERVFISFSNLNLLLLQVLHSTTILDTSFFPRLISTKTEDPILKNTSNYRKKRRYINICFKTQKQHKCIRRRGKLAEHSHSTLLSILTSHPRSPSCAQFEFVNLDATWISSVRDEVFTI